MATSPRKLRVLCLHGYVQNADVFRRRSAVLRKDLKDIAEMTYIDGPTVIPPDRLEFELTDEQKQSALAWWLMDADGIHYEHYTRFEDHIRNIWSKEGPFDVILGFSQGALAAALAGQLVQPPPRFTVLFSGFLPKSETHAEVFRSGKEALIPSLQFLGDTDQWVAPQRSLDLAALYPQDKVCVQHHKGGHFIPTDKPIRTFLKEWFTARRDDPSLATP